MLMGGGVKFLWRASLTALAASAVEGTGLIPHSRRQYFFWGGSVIFMVPTAAGLIAGEVCSPHTCQLCAACVL